MPRGEVVFESPPEIPEELPRSMGQMLMALPMVAGAGAMAFMYAGRGSSPFTYVVGALFGVSMLGMMVGQMGSGRSGGERKAELDAERRDYMRYLAQVRRRVRRAADQQRQALAFKHPAPEALWSIASGNRLWERRVTDEDFTELRVAVGPQRLAVRLVPPETKPVEDLEPMSAIALRRFIRIHSTVPDLPVAVSLRAFSRIALRGDRSTALDLVRSVLGELVTFHSPDDVWVAVCAVPERLAEWDWTKWLPHAQFPGENDAAGPVRQVFESVTEMEEFFGTDLSERQRHHPGATPPPDTPHLVVVLDGVDIPPGANISGAGLVASTVLDFSGVVPREAGRSALTLAVEPDALGIERKDGAQPIGRPDRLSRAQAEALARQLAPHRMSAQSGGDEPLSVALELPDLLHIGDPNTLDAATSWRPRPNRERLRVPIGLGPDGGMVELDIKEAAQEGMGPHGLLIGATGSGKSELLRTLVCALAIRHSSEELNFVLVDFKGGATFTKLDVLPHTSAVITNLADELPLVDRMQDAIAGEVLRRQELLRAAGNYANLKDYEAARRSGAPLDPLPSLFIVCDEFSEMLAAKPDFIDLFVMIGRVGRSLGVHLLLASQRLEEGKLRGLDTYLSYRVGLRTFSAVESRIVLGVPDAYELPNAPGHGYLKIDTSTMIRFRAAYVSGPYKPAEQQARSLAAVSRQVIPFTAGFIPLPPQPEVVESVPDDSESAETVLDIIVRRLEGKGAPAHQVWLAPLAEPSPLDELLPPLQADPARGLCPAGWDGLGKLTVPVGIVDKPYEQRRDQLWAELDGAAGHVLVVGGPQSGKSNLIRNLICSLALTHTPREAQFFCMDFGGGGLASLRELPHVGGVASRMTPDMVRRMVAEAAALVAEREEHFAERGIDSIATFRRRRAAGDLDEDKFGDLFLVVDGWLTLRQEFEELEQQIIALAARGLGFGVHLVIAATRWADIRPALRDLLGTRFELRLGDPSESDIDRRAAVNVPERTPGRGLTRDKLHFLGAIPRIDGQSTVEDLPEAVAKFVSSVQNAWPGEPAPRVRLLPASFPMQQLPGVAEATEPGVPVGINEAALAPVYLDFASEPHFIVFGDTESGKTNLLRVIAQQVVARYTPKEARLIIADYRRTMLGAVSGDQVIGYAASGPALQPMINEVLGAMRKRLPGPDVTPEQLRNRSWWTGPDLYLLVDDYDLVATPAGNPLGPLLEFLPQARDVGLHLIVARRSGGAGRALFEPVLQRLKELGTPGLVMSGSREEGQLLGTVRPSALPPGRGYLVRRRDGTQLIHLAWSPPE